MKAIWKVAIAVGVIAVLIAVAMGILMGMSKSYVLKVDYCDEVLEYDINTSLMSYMRRKIKYGNSLFKEWQSSLDGAGYNEALLSISSDFGKVIDDMKAHEVAKVESKINFVNSNEKLFEYTLGVGGLSIDNNSYETILHSIDSNIIAKNILKKDEIMGIEEMQKRTKLLASYTTEYATSGEARRENIRIATNYLNGAVIEPQATLSYNEIVGERTAERGFKEAKVIVNGEYVSGFGGGVCQVSTTLYNAWVLSGGGVVYASNHSLPPHYVDLSRDAMVSSYNDLILLNNSETPIYVRAYCGIDNVIFEIYGKENDNVFSIESETIEEIKPGTKYIGEVNEGEEYEEIVVSEGVPGYKSRAYLLESDKDGNILSKKLLREDEYKSQPKIVERLKVG